MNRDRQRFAWLLAIAASSTAAIPIWLGWPKPRSHEPTRLGVATDTISPLKDESATAQVRDDQQPRPTPRTTSPPTTRSESDSEVNVDAP